MSDYSETGTPVVMPTNIRDLRVDPAGIARVSEEHVARLARHKLRAGDIVYSRRGDVEKCALITDAEEGWLCGTGCLLVRVHGPRLNARFLSYALSYPETRAWISQHAVGATMPNLNTDILRDVPITVPELELQRAIAATLGALDDKIESNRRVRGYLRDLGKEKFRQALDQSSRHLALGDLTLSIARGVSPKYADENPSASIVINQKCIRDGWVSLDPARRMHERDITPAKRAAAGDILVNSTGVGTLGRVARWPRGTVFVDSHVSVVKPDLNKIDPVLLAYALLGREDDIEALATGSTGQTELSPARLGSLSISIPTGETAELTVNLVAIETRANQLALEISRLMSLRDTLLPELLSGRIRVPVQEVVA